MSDKSQPRSGKQRLAVVQAEQARAARQKKLLAVLSGFVVVVLIAVGVAWAVSSQSKSSQDKKALAQAKSNAFISTVTSIPAASFDAVGAGGANGTPQKFKSPKVETENGKPVMTYIGAEFCPYCGMERWAMVAALSRFGTFTGIQSEVSSSTDSPANIPTMTFLHAKYTSKYLVFNSYETQDRNHNPLQTPPAAIVKVETSVNPQGSIPWIDFGGQYYTSGVTYDGSSMSNQSAAAVAAQLKNTSSTIAKGVLGAANAMTVQICNMTHGEPTKVCQSKGVILAAGGIK
ncbi:DUF929 family protein [Leekyejoonella antrihumi]|uniref:DUF929 domain-containing protein n=1 Tax=Leekyejoonella antrihumi TaxID=1660198 RepID=A0A563DWN6_9MICO|nr:DUF929 family protein [Leekyejoonella antrihumi]TWP34381.1 DUF929 domain-containing protein [Leekyejoonella antrihumi]